MTTECPDADVLPNCAALDEEAPGWLAAVRARFGACVQEDDAPSPILGTIQLRADQVETLRRVRAHLRRDGGCLLADEVGTGKTYVALAAARAWTSPLVIVPASLRTTWELAARRAELECTIASHESLSRGRRPATRFDGVVVDESHRFRVSSRRHAVLAELTAHVPVLLLSATPMQNRASELAGQLALFLGEVAFGLAPAALARWIVRSPVATSVPLPRVAPARWVDVGGDDEAVLNAILALPPPPRAADAGDGGALLQLSLVRAWASSRAALVATLRRRRRTLTAIEQCQLEGRTPTRRELRSWSGDDAVQLGFPSLLAASALDGARAEAIGVAIQRERAGLDALDAAIARAGDVDLLRVRALRRLRDEHQGRSALAFSEWASTVRAYWAALRADPMVGLLTADEARIASGRITRDALLARFAPAAHDAPLPAERERVTLLLATDLLSEGVNLQDASVVVHLDLPWNPARLAQRLGRVRRPGGACEVASFLVAPPARAGVLLRVESRLRAKLARAERIVGRGMDVLPRYDALGGALSFVLPTHDFGADAARPSSAELRSEISRRLERWRAQAERDEVAADATCRVACVAAARRGWVAALDDGRLVASIAVEHAKAAVDAEDDVETVARALELADGPSRRADVSLARRALAAVEAWIVRDWSLGSAGLSVDVPPLRRRILRALDDALRATPRHRRAIALERATGLRHALATPLPLGLERALATLADRADREGDWIERACALVARSWRRTDGEPTGPPRVRALIVFGPEES